MPRRGSDGEAEASDGGDHPRAASCKLQAARAGGCRPPAPPAAPEKAAAIGGGNRADKAPCLSDGASITV